MMRLLLTLFCVLNFSTISMAESAPTYNYIKDVRQTRRIIARLDQMEVAKKTDKAIEEMVAVATDQLKKAGFKDEAARIDLEFENSFQGYTAKLITKRLKGLGDIGDHRPLSKWLTELYNTLYDLLGPQVMALTHLEDIKVINYTIPVVFHLEGVTNPEIDPVEYEKHWDPFWGVVTYWTVWGTCEAVTYGGGWFLICSPAGMAAKYVVVQYIAPKFSANGYDFFYNSDLRQAGQPLADRLGCIGKNVIDLCK